ncbi:MAG: hypothetical protein ACM3ZB_06635 [bacterium]
MKKLFAAISRVSSDLYGVGGWDAAVRQRFGPYLLRKSILKRERESLHSELVNLDRVEAFPDQASLLLLVLRKYRATIRADKKVALNFLIECFEGCLRADERWMGLFISHDPLPVEAPLHDRASQAFAVLDTILEGCYKPHLRVLFGFAQRDQTGQFPPHIAKRDFGKLLSFISDAYSSRARFLLEDAEHGISVNQWRNVAAHRSFVVQGQDAIGIQYGRDTVVSKTIPFAGLIRVVDWAVRCVGITRMANVITYLEYMADLKESGLTDDRVSLRLESGLVGLCHNLRLVGFAPTSFSVGSDLFVLDLIDCLNRTPQEAIIHGSQALDQIAVILECDPTKAHRVERIAVRLVDSAGQRVAQATIALADALGYTQRKLSLKQRISRTTFEFADWLRSVHGASPAVPAPRRNN